MLNKEGRSAIHLDDVSHEIVVHSGSRTVPIFEHVTWEVTQGYAHVIQGISGSGKSTLLALLAGFQNPTRGTVYYDDIDLVTCSKSDKASVHTMIGFVFQQPFLLHELTVIENVMMKELLHNKGRDLCRIAAEHMLGQVGLAHRASDSIDGLSGGEQQRIALARALCGKPSFLLLDEPTAHLDDASKWYLLNLIKKIQMQENIGVVITTHDQGVAAAFDQVWYIRDHNIYRKE